MSFCEADWDDLLQFIHEGRVIPLIGPELLRIDDGTDAQIPLDQYLARRFAERLGVSTDDIPEENALTRVVCRYLEKSPQNIRETIYPQFQRMVDKLQVPIPQPLRTLAEIREFQIYVTTAVHPLVEQAIAAARGRKPIVGVYSPNSSNVDDLDRPASESGAPVVFYLMGRISSMPDYVITEEDVLEFLNAMQSGRRPTLLFESLQTHHLLLLGCRHPDWLARFFIRLVKGARLSGPRDWQEIVADRTIARDQGLATFLQHFSYRTRVFTQGDATAFVEELGSRYRAAFPHAKTAENPDRQRRDRQLSPGAVFVSYAGEDRLAAEKIAALLEQIGAEVWIDQSQLKPGDDWNRIIGRNIRHCSLFVPLVSKNTEAILEGYFRREWHLAEDRSFEIHESVPFIVPILIDDVRMEEAKVPEAFKRRQSFLLRPDDAPDGFKKGMTELLRTYRKRERCAP